MIAHSPEIRNTIENEINTPNSKSKDIIWTLGGALAVVFVAGRYGRYLQKPVVPVVENPNSPLNIAKDESRKKIDDFVVKYREIGDSEKLESNTKIQEANDKLVALKKLLSDAMDSEEKIYDELEILKAQYEQEIKLATQQLQPQV